MHSEKEKKYKKILVNNVVMHKTASNEIDDMTYNLVCMSTRALLVTFSVLVEYFRMLSILHHRSLRVTDSWMQKQKGAMSKRTKNNSERFA